MTAAERAYAEAAEQGLPRTVEDPALLDAIARLLVAEPDDGDR